MGSGQHCTYILQKWNDKTFSFLHILRIQFKSFINQNLKNKIISTH